MSNEPRILREWRTAHGEAIISELAPAVLLFKYKGHMDETVVPVIKEVVDGVWASGARPDLFVDTWDVTSYENQFRVDMTKWAGTINNRVGVYLILMRSKMVAMLLAVAKLLIGSGVFTATTSPEEFGKAVTESVRRAGRAGASAPAVRAPPG